jgi:hypothetical protein
MHSTLQVIEKIETENKEIPEMRFINDIKPGQGIRQGDIYIINVDGLTDITVFKNINVKCTKS